MNCETLLFATRHAPSSAIQPARGLPQLLAPIRMPAISQEQLAALHDELAALARVGIPLEQGLTELGRDFSGRLGRVATELGERLSAGESLEQALANPRLGIPTAYRAIIDAGMRSGKVADSFQEVAETSRRRIELGRSLRLAFAYPAIALALAYLVFLLVIVYVTPRVLGAYPDLARPFQSSWGWLQPLSDHVWSWAPWPPLAALLALVVFWRWTMHAGPAANLVGGAARRHALTPGRVIAMGQLATLLDTLASLISQRVPLPEAVRLAADITGVKSWRSGAYQWAERLEAGEPPTRQNLETSGLPSILGCLASTEGNTEPMVAWLRHLSNRCRRRAEMGIDWHKQILPFYLSVVVGLGIILPVGVVLVAPWFELLADIVRSE
ncbi:MAG: type II secretion system F family protein [Pirellulales bacterium]